MKYSAVITIICIFQSINFSVACHGYTVEVVEVESGPKNNLKMLRGMHFELSDDCVLMANNSLVVERPYTSATVSVKAKSDQVDLLTIKHENLCKFLSDYDISGFKCPSLEPGRISFEVNGQKDISEYRPFLGFLAGKITILFKVIYDGDTDNPDMLAVVINIKPKDDIPEWTF